MDKQHFTSYWYGTRKQYGGVPKSGNTLYFISDENKLCRGNQPFAEDVEKVICVSATAPTVATVGQKYFNTACNKIFQCIALETGDATWGDGIEPCEYVIYYDMGGKTLYSWDGTTFVGMCNAASAAEAAIYAAEAAASAAISVNTRYNCEALNMEYSNTLGNYRALTRVGDTLKPTYAISNATIISLHLKSANNAITGFVILTLSLGGVTI